MTTRPSSRRFDAGLMDLFPLYTGTAGTAADRFRSHPDQRSGHGILRWQYGDRPLELCSALRDERQLLRHDVWSFDRPACINLVSGQTNGVIATLNGTGDEVSGGSDGSLTVIGDRRSARRCLLHSNPRAGDAWAVRTLAIC